MYDLNDNIFSKLIVLYSNLLIIYIYSVIHEGANIINNLINFYLPL